MILCLFTNVLLLSAASSMAVADDQLQDYQRAKSGCPDECGGVKIPFPFGIQDGCYFNNDPSYRIKCDTTKPKPIPLLDSAEVLSINLQDHSIRISSRVAYQCHNRSGKLVTSTDSSAYTLHNLTFDISATRNKFVAVGCDTNAIVEDSVSVGLDLTGCMTSCQSLPSVSKGGTCSGLGCCETSIFDSISRPPRIQVGSFNNHTRLSSNPCSFAFIGEVGSYKFSVANLNASATDLGNMSVAVVYDWSVHDSSHRSCSEAEKGGNGKLICGSNAKCVEGNDTRPGYRCQCLEGFTGNPYLPQGCHDINECLDLELCDFEICYEFGTDVQCQQACVNTIGSYYCRCPEGMVYTGNDTESGPSCQPLPPAKIGLVVLILCLTIGIGSIISFIAFYWLNNIFKRLKEKDERKNNFRRNGGLSLQHKISANEGARERTKIFSRIELEKATDNFNDNRVLGHGGQGTVYKGMLVDGTTVAVKKSKKVDENQLAQFINEVVILTQINHRNVVKLFGCCLETEVPLLVYEFVPNGTLYHHIQNPSEDFHITWKIRFQIAVECAGALAYLHSSCCSPVYHRDIKSSNILLDEKYQAKIPDFGTSKTISIDQTHVTTHVQGTFGYLDPEFFRSHQFNEKSDVYSFGVVLLELLTSKKPIFTDESEELRGLAMVFLQLMENRTDQLYGMLDAQVLQGCSRHEIEALAKLTKQMLEFERKA